MIRVHGYRAILLKSEASEDFFKFYSEEIMSSPAVDRVRNIPLIVEGRSYLKQDPILSEVSVASMM